MPETPDQRPRRRWALENANGAVHRGRRPMLCDPSSLTAGSVWVYLDANWSSIGGVHHAEEEQEERASQGAWPIRLSLGGHC